MGRRDLLSSLLRLLRFTREILDPKVERTGNLPQQKHGGIAGAALEFGEVTLRNPGRLGQSAARHTTPLSLEANALPDHPQISFC